jgi:LemA protein
LRAVLFVGLIVVLLLAVAVYVLLTYNRLVALRLNVDNSWAQVDVALKLRHDLVPNLAAAVAGYAAHERGTFEEVTAARNAAVAAPDQPGAALGTAEAQLGQGIGRLFALAEAYPDLKASELFQRLQAQLAEIENKLQITRRVYNDVVERYVVKISTVPSMLVAKAFGFQSREFFKAPVEAQGVPSVSLGGGATEPSA